MKKVTITFLMAIVSLAVVSCSGGDGGGKSSGGSSLEDLGAKYCKAAEAGDPDAMEKLIHPKIIEMAEGMMDAMKDAFDGMGEGEGSGEMTTTTVELDSCRFVRAEETECEAGALIGLKMFGIDIEACGTMVTDEKKDGVEAEKSITAIKSGGKWYLGMDNEGEGAQ